MCEISSWLANGHHSLMTDITDISHISHTWSHLITFIFLFIGSSPSLSALIGSNPAGSINLLSFLFSPIFSVVDSPYGVYCGDRAGDLSIGCCRDGAASLWCWPRPPLGMLAEISWWSHHGWRASPSSGQLILQHQHVEQLQASSQPGNN